MKSFTNSIQNKSAGKNPLMFYSVLSILRGILLMKLVMMYFSFLFRKLKRGKIFTSSITWEIYEDPSCSVQGSPRAAASTEQTSQLTRQPPGHQHPSQPHLHLQQLDSNYFLVRRVSSAFEQKLSVKCDGGRYLGISLYSFYQNASSNDILNITWFSSVHTYPLYKQRDKSGYCPLYLNINWKIKQF